MSPIPDDPNQAQAWISGEAPDQTIDFYIPRGNRGPTGPQGPAGPSLLVGTVETVTGPVVQGTAGPQGLTGPKGDPGGIVLGTSLGTADLNTIMAAGVYRQGSSVPANCNYPSPELGVLIVHQPSANPWLIQEYQPAGGLAAKQGATFYRRTYVGTTWSAWKTYSATRVDQTAGRAIYQWDDLNSREQLIYGDTGWREFAAPVVTNGITSGNFRIRRVGNQVQLFTVDVSLSTAITGYCALLTPTQIPIGFRPHGGWRSMQAIGSQNNAVAQQWITNFGEIGWTHQVSTAGVFSSARPSVNLYGSITWTTDETWPISLPGIAQGSIPNL